ncbi:MAG: non-canonical purine NTP pyrophosphatase, partial [Patescibacteria group bacterium]
MKKILIASTNPGKITEIKIGLKELKNQGIEILTLNDVIVGEKEPQETGATFQDNAFIKAKFYADETQLPVISDDGGLVIPYLNNEPGVKSRRWLGYDASDQELVNYTLKRLHGVKLFDRKAYLEACLCFYNPQTNDTVFESEKILGSI